MRREIHCASSATLNSSASITLVLPAQCPTGTGNVTWCAVGSGSRYGLHRSTANPCDATDPKWADYLVNSAVFGYVVAVDDEPGQGLDRAARRPGAGEERRPVPARRRDRPAEQHARRERDPSAGGRGLPEMCRR